MTSDSDNDGVPDIVEGHDANRNGIADWDNDGDNDITDIAGYTTDADNDGLYDIFDNQLTYNINNVITGTAAIQNTDFVDNKDFRDTDDDNDNILTATELGGDGIGYNDFAQGGTPIPDYLYRPDTDGDNIADVNDLDSDNDGIPDTQEDGGTGFDPSADDDGDGTPNYADTDLNGGAFADADNNGIIDLFDRDGDGIPDFQDLDSDNDGITDLAEAGGTDADGNGRIDGFVDSGPQDGLDDNTAITPLAVADSDGDGLPDYLDLDSDNDGITDRKEQNQADLDRNGRIDGFVDNNNDGLDDNVAANPITLLDTDGDGRFNHLDRDADNDGITDPIEAGGRAPTAKA